MDTQQVKTGVGYLIGGFHLALGARSILNPVGQTKAFGIPYGTQTTSYMPAIGARNLSIGAAVAYFIFTGEKRPAGVLIISSGFLMGIIDSWFLWKQKRAIDGDVVEHVIGDTLCMAAGRWLMM
jgi:hypothetical protein